VLIPRRPGSDGADATFAGRLFDTRAAATMKDPVADGGENMGSGRKFSRGI